MDTLFVSPSVCIKLWLWWVLNEPAYCRGWMYGIIRGHPAPPEGKLPLTALVTARTTPNVTVRQRPPNVRKTTVCPLFKILLSNSQTLRQCYFHLLLSRHSGAPDAPPHPISSLQQPMLQAKTYLQAAQNGLQSWRTLTPPVLTNSIKNSIFVTT